MPNPLKANTPTALRPTPARVELVTKVGNSLDNCLVDERVVARPNGAYLSGYRHVERSRLISSADVSAIFGKQRDWFGRHRNRKALERRGFPKPVIRGQWLRTAVEAWLEREGKRPAL